MNGNMKRSSAWIPHKVDRAPEWNDIAIWHLITGMLNDFLVLYKIVNIAAKIVWQK